MIAAVLVYVARYPPERTFGAAARLQGTAIAIALAGAIIECASVVHSASRGRGLTLRTDVTVAFSVIGEVRARVCERFSDLAALVFVALWPKPSEHADHRRAYAFAGVVGCGSYRSLNEGRGLVSRRVSLTDRPRTFKGLM